MGFRAYISKYIKFDDLSDEEKDDLHKRFTEHKRELESLIKNLDRSLARLAKKPKRKKIAKR